MWATKQKEAFKMALVGGALRQFVSNQGGTGELREPLSIKEKTKRKRRKQIARASRQRNR